MTIQLFPKIKIAYFIYSPDYTHTSSGVRALHLLCHALNSVGQRAFMFPIGKQDMVTNPELLTPVVTKEVIKRFPSAVVIYPDIVRGNPLNAKKVVRWLLAPAGRYGGEKDFSSDEQVWGYTTPIAHEQGTDRVLLLPTFNQWKFYPPPQDNRNGSCFYSHKYEMHGNKLTLITKDSTRLVGDSDYIAETLRTSTTCYVYEMSEIIMLAGMCECPVVLVKTPYFHIIPNDIDFDWPHARWSDEPSPKSIQFNRIKHNLEDLHRKFEDFQLPRFIEETQQWRLK